MRHAEALAERPPRDSGRRFDRDLSLAVADLGWSIRLPKGASLKREEVESLLSPNNFAVDVLEGLDRGELPARRFRHVASTALMVLRNPEGGKRRVGGLLWVSNRLYPLVKAACPNHPLLRETQREVLNDQFDTPSAMAWLASRPHIRFQKLRALSPFASAWIDPSEPEPFRFESPAEALRRLHARVITAAARSA